MAEIDFASAIADPEAWQKSLAPADRQELGGVLQGSADPKAAVRRMLAIGYAAHVTDSSPYTVANQWDGFGRSQFSTDPRGLGLDAPVKDDGEFFTGLQEKVQKQNDENDMLQNGPDSLRAMAHLAGIDGKDYNQAFADWQAGNIDANGYDQNQADAYHRYGRMQYEDSLQRGNYGQIGKIADRAVSLIEGDHVMTKNGEWVAPEMDLEDRTRLVGDLAEYPPEARRYIYSVMAQKFQAQGLDPKSAFRGLDSAARGFSTIVNGGLQAATRVLSALPGVVNDPEVDAARKSIGEQQIVYGELTQLANRVIDPIKGNGWASSSVNGLGALAPWIATGGAGLGWAGTAAMAAGISTNVSSQVKWDNPHMDQGAADTIGVISGTAQTLLLGKVGQWLTESAPGVSQLLTRLAQPDMNAALRYGSHVIGQGLSHGVTFGIDYNSGAPFKLWLRCAPVGYRPIPPPHPLTPLQHPPTLQIPQRKTKHGLLFDRHLLESHLLTMIKTVACSVSATTSSKGRNCVAGAASLSARPGTDSTRLMSRLLFTA